MSVVSIYQFPGPVDLWTWAMAGYLLMECIYHVRKRSLPYQEGKEWLALPDLIALTVVREMGKIKTAPHALQASCPKLQIYFMDNTPSEIKIRGAIFWQWIIACWLTYLMDLGDEKSVKVFISRAQNGDCRLKGGGNIEVEEVSHPLEGIRCPFCMKPVRNLFRTRHVSEAACRECLRTRVENKLRYDWETGEEMSALWLANQMASYFRLGNFQCGIHHWEQWEYFVTLHIRKAKMLCRADQTV